MCSEVLLQHSPLTSTLPSPHPMMSVGDAPVGCARWRFDTTQAGGGGRRISVIDRLCLLQPYRCRGYARKCMERIIEDVSAVGGELRVDVAGIVVPVPPRTLLQSKLEAAGFVQQGEMEHRGIRSLQMCLPKSGSSSSLGPS